MHIPSTMVMTFSRLLWIPSLNFEYFTIDLHWAALCSWISCLLTFTKICLPFADPHSNPVETPERHISHFQNSICISHYIFHSIHLSNSTKTPLLERKFHLITRLLLRRPLPNSGSIPATLPILVLFVLWLFADFEAFRSQCTLLTVVDRLEAVRILCTSFPAIFGRSDIRNCFIFA